MELGAGVGAAGLTLAALGARVTLTDKRAMLPLLRGNIARNWLAAGSMCALTGSCCLQPKRACCRWCPMLLRGIAVCWHSAA